MVECDKVWLELGNLLAEEVDIRPGREGDNPKPLAESGNDIERLPPNGTG
jgi:hypothetical protein